MNTDNRQQFDTNDIDDTLAVIETAGGNTYLKFSYINAIGPVPVNMAITVPIEGPTASQDDLDRLIAAVAHKGKEEGGWVMDGAEPWLLSRIDFEKFNKRRNSG